MADPENQQAAECPHCRKRGVLRAVADELLAAVADEPKRHQHWEFLVCRVCGWNDLPEKQHMGR